MFGLALHTSTPQLGFALSDFQSIHRHQDWDLGRDLSRQLHQLLGDFLAPQAWSDLTFIAVCIGPGGFTGTRIGVATARTLAQQLQLPLFGISALGAVAYPTEQAYPPDTDIAVTMPAKRGAVYGGIYRWNGKTLSSVSADQILPAPDWQIYLEQWSRPLKTVEIDAAAGLGYSAPALLQLSYEAWQAGERPVWHQALPFYGQQPVAAR